MALSGAVTIALAMPDPVISGAVSRCGAIENVVGSLPRQEAMDRARMAGAGPSGFSGWGWR